MARGSILTDTQRMGLICDYVGGSKVKDLIEPLGISERTGFNVLSRVGVHRCRCGDVHVKDVGNCVWALRDSPPHLLKAGMAGRITGVAVKRVSIMWSNGQGEIIDCDNAGKLFTFKRDLELFP